MKWFLLGSVSTIATLALAMNWWLRHVYELEIEEEDDEDDEHTNLGF